MRRLFICLLLVISPFLANAQSASQPDELLRLIQSFSKTSAVTGREEEAAAFLQSPFAAGTVKKDKLGNLILTIGSGCRPGR